MSSIEISVPADGGAGDDAGTEEGGSTLKAFCILCADLVRGKDFILGSTSFFKRK
tara:strand:+ start:1028 stop:1192 length:165 start_codon:yes stop_codon:yes gene_type:complete